MAPVPAGAALLFHPKKNAKRPIAPPRSVSPNKPAAPKPKPVAPVVDDDAPPPLPDGPYTEFKLVSSALNGWKYDVMKFDSRKPVDVFTWQAPVKLNRKDLRRQNPNAEPDESESRAVGPMLGPDGKAVIGMDGRMVMVDAEGKPIHPGQPSTPARDKPKDGAQKRKKPPKKTKQVFKIPEATRQLRREERYPWVMEDGIGRETWVGSMEEASKSETHAFFMPAQNNTFKFVPAHRWYKFQKKPSHYIPTLEEAEAAMAARNKNKDPSLWLKQKRGGQAPSAATAAMFKAESDGSNDLTQNFAPNGRRLRTVRREDELFGDDDDEGGARRRRADGADADFEEIPYHEEFADDEEKMGVEEEEDEVEKEMEERLQREYMSANKQRDGHVDDDADGEDDEETSTAKAMRKLLTKRDKNAAYDSDEEKNPYASSEEEEEEEQVVSNEPAVQSHLTTRPSRPQTPSQTKSSQPGLPATTPSSTDPNHRATSPTAGSPVSDHGGHSVVAKRATSPKAPKAKSVNGIPRATSPLAQARPPVANGSSAKMTNPASPSSSSPAASSPKVGNKRKATDDNGDSAAPVPSTSNEGGQPKPKKRKPAGPAIDANGNLIELTDDMVLDWLRKTPNVKTRDCIAYFTPYLHNEEQKQNFTALIKTVASLKNGVLVLKSVYRNGGRRSNGSSPASTPMDLA